MLTQSESSTNLYTFTSPHAPNSCCCHPPTANPDVVQLVDGGADVNEVEAAGNTPLHSAAFEGWLEGAQLLLQLGAKINASNNAGDTPWVTTPYTDSGSKRERDNCSLNTALTAVVVAAAPCQHWATNMGHTELVAFLEAVSAHRGQTGGV